MFIKKIKDDFNNYQQLNVMVADNVNMVKFFKPNR